VSQKEWILFSKIEISTTTPDFYILLNPCSATSGLPSLQTDLAWHGMTSALLNKNKDWEGNHHPRLLKSTKCRMATIQAPGKQASRQKARGKEAASQQQICCRLEPLSNLFGERLPFISHEPHPTVGSVWSEIVWACLGKDLHTPFKDGQKSLRGVRVSGCEPFPTVRPGCDCLKTRLISQSPIKSLQVQPILLLDSCSAVSPTVKSSIDNLSNSASYKIFKPKPDEYDLWWFIVSSMKLWLPKCWLPPLVLGFNPRWPRPGSKPTSSSLRESSLGLNTRTSCSPVSSFRHHASVDSEGGCTMSMRKTSSGPPSQRLEYHGSLFLLSSFPIFRSFLSRYVSECFAKKTNAIVLSVLSKRQRNWVETCWKAKSHSHAFAP